MPKPVPLDNLATGDLSYPILVGCYLTSLLFMQVFVALLRLCQAKNKTAVVRDSLDPLTPVLVQGLASEDL